MTARFPTAPRRLSGHDLGEIPFAAGSFDVVEYRPRGVVLFGWMLMPDGAFDDIEVFWNSQQAGSAPQGPRADVGAALAWAAGAADSGFVIELDDLELGSPGRVDLLGHREGGPAARLSTLVWPPSEDSAPLPPPELADRVLRHRAPSSEMAASRDSPISSSRSTSTPSGRKSEPSSTGAAAAGGSPGS